MRDFNTKMNKNISLSFPQELIDRLKEVQANTSPRRSLSELIAPILSNWCDKELCIQAIKRIGSPKIWDRTYPLVDAQDQPLADSVKWRASPNGWVNRRRVNGKQIAIYLHREILKVTGNQSYQTIFRNGDRLDCRRKNMQLLTMSELRS